jgi:hypothetical protein
MNLARTSTAAKSLAALGVVAALLAFASAAPASADVVTTVTPTTNLTNGQTVAVFDDSGRPFNASLVPDDAHVNLCANTGAAGVQCKDIGTLPPDVRQTTSRNEYVWDGNVNVADSFTPAVGAGVTCATQCFLRVIATFNQGQGSVQVGADVPLTYKAPK